MDIFNKKKIKELETTIEQLTSQLENTKSICDKLTDTLQAQSAAHMATLRQTADAASEALKKKEQEIGQLKTEISDMHERIDERYEDAYNEIFDLLLTKSDDSVDFSQLAKIEFKDDCASERRIRRKFVQLFAQMVSQSGFSYSEAIHNLMIPVKIAKYNASYDNPDMQVSEEMYHNVDTSWYNPSSDELINLIDSIDK